MSDQFDQMISLPELEGSPVALRAIVTDLIRPGIGFRLFTGTTHGEPVTGALVVPAVIVRVGDGNTTCPTVRDDTAGVVQLHAVQLLGIPHVVSIGVEKSALICQAFCDPAKRLWMATAGKAALKRERLQPLIDRNRYIVLYPDYDGHEEWVAAAKRIDYPRLSVSEQVRKYHIPADGDKADMADIMLRLVCAPQETEAEKIARQLGRPDKAEDLQYLMDKLDLQRV